MTNGYIVVGESHDGDDSFFHVVPEQGVEQWDVVKELFVAHRSSPLVASTSATRNADDSVTVVWRYSAMFGGEQYSVRVLNPKTIGLVELR